MEIRRFREEDAGETSLLVCRGLIEECSKDYPESEVEQYCKMYSPSGLIQLSKEQEMWVSHDGIIKGMASRKENIIEMCYVLPELIGKKIGTSLMHHLEGNIIDENYLVAKVGAGKNAVRFYELLGYVKYGEDKGDILMRKGLLPF